MTTEILAALTRDETILSIILYGIRFMSNTYYFDLSQQLNVVRYTGLYHITAYQNLPLPGFHECVPMLIMSLMVINQSAVYQ